MDSCFRRNDRADRRRLSCHPCEGRNPYCPIWRKHDKVKLSRKDKRRILWKNNVWYAQKPEENVRVNCTIMSLSALYVVPQIGIKSVQAVDIIHLPRNIRLPNITIRERKILSLKSTKKWKIYRSCIGIDWKACLSGGKGNHSEFNGRASPESYSPFCNGGILCVPGGLWSCVGIFW